MPRNVSQHQNCDFALVVTQDIKFVQHKCQVGNFKFVGEARGYYQANNGYSPHALHIPQAECDKSFMMHSKFPENVLLH
jgi:hypothetical protein